MQLQLASLEFCAACRSVPTLHVNVGKDTPISLWMGAPAPAQETRGRKRLSSTCVPVVRAHEVTWDLSSWALLRMGDALSKVEVFTFYTGRNFGLGGVA